MEGGVLDVVVEASVGAVVPPSLGAGTEPSSFSFRTTTRTSESKMPLPRSRDAGDVVGALGVVGVVGAETALALKERFAEERGLLGELQATRATANVATTGRVFVFMSDDASVRLNDTNRQGSATGSLRLNPTRTFLGSLVPATRDTQRCPAASKTRAPGTDPGALAAPTRYAGPTCSGRGRGRRPSRRQANR
jgi:hypothetical protein